MRWGDLGVELHALIYVHRSLRVLSGWPLLTSPKKSRVFLKRAVHVKCVCFQNCDLTTACSPHNFSRLCYHAVPNSSFHVITFYRCWQRLKEDPCMYFNWAYTMIANLSLLFEPGSHCCRLCVVLLFYLSSHNNSIRIKPRKKWLPHELW